jgi:hypothetical protein
MRRLPTDLVTVVTFIRRHEAGLLDRHVEEAIYGFVVGGLAASQHEAKKASPTV